MTNVPEDASTLDEEGLRLSIESNRCPDCGNYGFLDGPKGGLSQNIFCGNPACRSGFNVAPRQRKPVMRVQRIPKGGEQYYPPKVHILRYGKPLCAFYWGPPKEWPPGHLWAGEAVDATCPACKERING